MDTTPGDGPSRSTRGAGGIGPRRELHELDPAILLADIAVGILALVLIVSIVYSFVHQRPSP